MPIPRPRKLDIRTMLEKYASDSTLAGSQRMKTSSRNRDRKLMSSNDIVDSFLVSGGILFVSERRCIAHSL